MPNIESVKKSAPQRKKTQKTKLPIPIKTKKSNSPHDYYCCCAEKTKQGIPKGTKITQLAAHCKKNSSQLALAKQKVRESEKKKIIHNWQQIGLSLGKIIDQA